MTGVIVLVKLTLKMFSFNIKTQLAGVFKFLRFEQWFLFEERPFLWQIIVDGRPNCLQLLFPQHFLFYQTSTGVSSTR